MFDFHMHSRLSFDSEADPAEMVRAAERAGLREICFTDHFDQHCRPDGHHDIFTVEEYAREYDGLTSERLLIRRGVEMGLTVWNRAVAEDFLSQRRFDFVIGSAHFAGEYDPYFAEYWEGKDLATAFRFYLEQTLELVRLHDDFDVLGHLTYVCKSEHNPTHEAALYRDYREVSDEIMKVLIANGKGMEINTSGIDRCNAFLPSADYLRRFKELGGEIVTVGSDAHAPGRVGQYTAEALELLRDIFGYVCTFADRKPVFHKL